MPDNLLAAAKRARDFALSLNSPEARAGFLELAARWETEAQKLLSAAASRVDACLAPLAGGLPNRYLPATVSMTCGYWLGRPLS